jgi:two-component sensor histidine kinase
MRISLDAAVPLAFLTVELLTNAFKHAFPDRGETVTVASERDPDGRHAVLTIADDGIGLPTTNGKGSHQLGLKMVQGLAEQIGATLEWPGPGESRFSVRFPLEPSPAPGQADLGKAS